MALICGALLVLGSIAFVTLCPIGLRPHLAGANTERFAAYFLLGVLVAQAAGRRGLAATAVVVLAATGLEAAQALIPGRHAALPDATVKALGGVLGCLAFQAAFPIWRVLIRTAEIRGLPAAWRKAA